MSFEEIYNNMDNLAKLYFNKVKIVIRGRMYEGRQVKGIKISFKVNNPEIFIEGSQRIDITGLSYTIHSSSNMLISSSI